MKKFSLISESNLDSIYEVKFEVSIFVEAANEGEASYLAEDAFDEFDKRGLDFQKIITSVSKKDAI